MWKSGPLIYASFLQFSLFLWSSLQPTWRSFSVIIYYFVYVGPIYNKSTNSRFLWFSIQFVSRNFWLLLNWFPNNSPVKKTTENIASSSVTFTKIKLFYCKYTSLFSYFMQAVSSHRVKLLVVRIERVSLNT